MSQLDPMDRHNIDQIALDLVDVAARLRHDPSDAFNTEDKLAEQIKRLNEIAGRVGEVASAAIRELHRP